MSVQAELTPSTRAQLRLLFAAIGGMALACASCAKIWGFDELSGPVLDGGVSRRDGSAADASRLDANADAPDGDSAPDDGKVDATDRGDPDAVGPAAPDGDIEGPDASTGGGSEPPPGRPDASTTDASGDAFGKDAAVDGASLPQHDAAPDGTTSDAAGVGVLDSGASDATSNEAGMSSQSDAAPEGDAAPQCQGPGAFCRTSSDCCHHDCDQYNYRCR